MEKPEVSSTELLIRALAVDRGAWKPFVTYGVGFALMGLVVPLAVQLLVSNLAFVGVGVSLFTLTTLIFLALLFMQFFRYGQIVLLEYLERQVLVDWVPKLRQLKTEKQIYFFELSIIPKVLSKWALDGFEILLTLVVSSLVLMIYHPFYLIIIIAVWGSLWLLHYLGEKGLATALRESQAKYETWFTLNRGEEASAFDWLVHRDPHFKILKRQIVLLMAVQVLGSLALLIGGAWLFSINQLSLGQFVATELIGGGLFLTLGKLAKFMETHYSLMTSLVKLSFTQGEDVHE